MKNVQGVLNSMTKRLLFPKLLPIDKSHTMFQTCNQSFSTFNWISNLNTAHLSRFLSPIIPQYQQMCGMKIKGRLQLRCRGCYLISKQGRLHVECTLKPRHKQVQMMKSWKKRRILTFAHQKKIRDW